MPPFWFVHIEAMVRQQLRHVGVNDVIVIECSDGSTMTMPEGINKIVIQWLKCLIPNGFSDVTITSKKGKHNEVLIQIKAGSIIQAQVPWHQLELIKAHLTGEIS